MKKKTLEALALLETLVRFLEIGYQKEIAIFLCQSKISSLEEAELALGCGNNALSKIFLALVSVVPFPYGNYAELGELPVESYYADEYPLANTGTYPCDDAVSRKSGNYSPRRMIGSFGLGCFPVAL